MQLAIFMVLAGITIISGIIMVSADNIARSIFSHVLALLCIAGIYILLYAEFMAGVQVLIYAGGVSIMLLFALMLTKPAKGTVRALDHPWKLPAFIVAIILFGLMLYSVLNTEWQFMKEPSEVITPALIGKVMFVKYVIPFEVVSLILLVALIGAVVIGSTKKNESGEEKKGL
ncbi:MAG: NADH-quinone oxidoreductase subunit J [bacterium]